jgi:molybdopterin converting factor small subunit
MKIRILFFGATAEVAGRHDTHIDFEAGATVGSITDLVLHEYPQLRNYKLLFALNEEYTSPNRAVAEGDELAIFTQVSGG